MVVVIKPHTYHDKTINQKNTLKHNNLHVIISTAAAAIKARSYGNINKVVMCIASIIPSFLK